MRIGPRTIELGQGYRLRASGPGDAAALALAIEVSRDHLRSFMPWAADDGNVTAEAQRVRLAEMAADAEAGRGAEWHFITPGGDIAGSCALLGRQGPGILEIGYWVALAHTGRGLATAGAAALTAIGLAHDGIDHLEIRCDEANRVSAAIPARLGYRLDRTDVRDPEAPGEIGRLQVWCATSAPTPPASGFVRADPRR